MIVQSRVRWQRDRSRRIDKRGAADRGFLRPFLVAFLGMHLLDRNLLCFVAICLGPLCLAEVECGQTIEVQIADSIRRYPLVLATVNGVTLLVAELEARVSQLPVEVRGRQREPMVQVLIDQELVRQYLAERRLGASADEVDQAIRRWERRLQSEYTNQEDYFARTGLDLAAVRRRWEWQIGWPRFVARQLTPERTAKFFRDHRSQFDGTRIRVAHILWKLPETTATDDALESAGSMALEVREGLLRRELTFIEAAKQYSQTGSAIEGGEIGWIGRHHPMTPEFSDAAFRLEPGEVSPPVVSPFGVHLIRCLEIEMGTETLETCRDAVVRAAQAKLFRNIARRQTKSARIVIGTHETEGTENTGIADRPEEKFGDL